jgi:PAS domain S-box-containing protein
MAATALEHSHPHGSRFEPMDPVRDAARWRVLSELSESILGAGLDLPALLSSAARRVAELVGDVCLIALTAPAYPALRASSSGRDPGSPDPSLESLLTRIDGGLAPHSDSGTQLPARLTSMLRVPLRLRGESLGLLIAGRDRTSPAFEPEDEALLQQIADRIAVAVENAQLYAQSRSAQDRLGFLARASVSLISSANYDQTVRSLLQLAVPEIADLCIVDSVDELGSVRREGVRCVAPGRAEVAQGLEQAVPDIGEESAIGRALRLGQTTVERSVSDDRLCALVAGANRLRLKRVLGVGSLVVVPLVGRRRILGAMTLLWLDGGRPFERADVTVAEELAHRASLALDNALLYRAAEQESERLRLLVEEREKFTALVERSGDFIAMATPQGEVLYINPAGRQLVGLAPWDGRARRVPELWASVHADSAQAASLERLAKGGVVEVRGRLRHFGDQAPVDVEGQAFGIIEPHSGEALAIACVLHDVSAQKRLEEVRSRLMREAQASNAVLETVISSAPVGLAYLDRELRYVTINHALAEMNGLPRHEHLGRTAEEVLPPGETTTTVIGWIREVLRTGEPVARKELVWTSRQGAQHYSLGGCYPIRLNDEVIGVGIALVDLTERRRFEEALREREARLRLLSETLPQIVWTADPDGNVDYFNGRWTEYTGLNLEQMRAKRGWRQVVHPDDIRRVNRLWREAVRTGEGYNIEYRFRRASDGAYRWHLGRALPLHDEQGRIVKWFGTCTDIEDQKRVHDELHQAVKMRENFLSVASHELRTPLTALRLMVENISRSARTHPAKVDATWALDRACKLDTQINRLVRLVENLLDVSRLSSGRLALDLNEVDLAQVTRDVADRVRDEAASLDCQLVINAAEPVLGRWDHMRVEQVVTNVIGNALKYGAGKPVEVAVFAENGFGCIRVQDHGIGISRDQQGRIFERFERVASEQHYGGFGLGLWIAREIVEALGGNIAVESMPGQGAAFTVRLPVGA